MALTSRLTGRLMLTVVLLCGFAEHPVAQPRYSVTDLGTLPPFNVSQANGINASGQVVGSLKNTATGAEHAFVWTNGTLQDLGTLPGFSASAAVGINAVGQVSGEVFNSTGPSHAFSWTSSTGLVDIHAASTGFTSSEALGTINAAGQIVGQLTRADGTVHPFSYTSGAGMVDLGPMFGLIYGAAYGSNDAGAVVGTSWNGAGKAFLWTSDVGFTDLGPLPGFLYAWATAVNASGQVVGQASNDTGPIHGFLWTAAAGMIDLDPGGLLGFLYIQPYAINAQAVVVGQASNDSPTSRSAFVWQNGLITDLNTLIDSGLGWVLQIATGINDNGQITGTGTVGGQTHAFLLTLVGGLSPQIRK